MTASAAIRIEGQITSLPSGSVKVGPIDLTSADASGQTQWVVLQSGANTITVPCLTHAAWLRHHPACDQHRLDHAQGRHRRYRCADRQDWYDRA
jgi:hypothetical protein